MIIAVVLIVLWWIRPRVAAMLQVIVLVMLFAGIFLHPGEPFAIRHVTIRDIREIWLPIVVLTGVAGAGAMALVFVLRQVGRRER